MVKRRWIAAASATALAGLLSVGWLAPSRASDHDDGETDVKARSLNLTDLYVFREDWQTGASADQGNLILIMNSNPRSLPRQQYFFSTAARYEFHLSRVGTDRTVENDTPQADVTLRFTFGAPDANKVQTFTLTALLDGVTHTATGTTTPLGSANTLNSLTLGTAPVTVFAGLKEDPFFFDVEQFFKVRGGTASGFRSAANAIDFAAGYNVNSVVVRIPTTFLAGTSGSTVFDVWETVSLPNGLGSVK